MKAEGTDEPSVLAPRRGAEPSSEGDVSRCFWALLSTPAEHEVSEATQGQLKFVYVDPDAQRDLGDVAHTILGRQFTDFVYADERAHARSDLARIVQSRTLFGSVTRCRYASIAHLRRMLSSATRVTDAAPEYMPTDVVVNMVGNRLALCFFHAVSSPEVPSSTHCGNSAHAFDAAQSQQLWRQLYAATQEHLTRPLHYVFEVLGNAPQRQILLSWPPPEAVQGHHASDTYHAEDFARLVQGIHAGPAPGAGDTTSCTQRFRASHTLTASGRVRAISSVVIPYGSIVLACFQVTSDQPSSESSKVAATLSQSKLSDKNNTAGHDRRTPGESEWKSETHASIPVESAQAQSSLPYPRPTRPDAGPSTQDNVAALAAAATGTAPTKSCSSCGKSNSPEWRRGPSGHKTLCNACGLRYARSLSNKRKRAKDGTVVTVEPTGDPNMVPPSRGSGGGSRPGVHRRAHKRPALHDEASVPEMPSQSNRLASVLASLPQNAPADAASTYASQTVDGIPHSLVLAAAAATADAGPGDHKPPVPDLQAVPATAPGAPLLPASAVSAGSSPAVPLSGDYLARPPTAPLTQPPHRPDYDPKTLDAILSHTLLPASHPQTPIFAALTQSANAPTGAPLKKSDVAFSVPMDSMAVSASVTGNDATIGLLPASDSTHFSDMFTGLNQATVSQQQQT
ncbi:hypothetical protein MBRA1_000969 [Malassezia brasiliensis]|uniref:GATA-type domain-containing protein n=1 Tax=Malassezia brasiliensis TaxID=1821822 RepID=A0AAF0DRA8_9BASI|nr:hypothetical protein MBRA1_000969 [Malassezia brasiliensis]